MLRWKFSLVVLIAWSVAHADSNPKYFSAGSGTTDKGHYRIGGDRIRFGWRLASGCDEQTLRTEAARTKLQAVTFACDDQWYKTYVPPGGCMVFSYYNLDTDRYGWAAIQNKPSSWATRSISNDWSEIGNGDKQKYTYTVNGAKIELDIMNPLNVGKVDGNDIFFGFDTN